MILKDNLGKRRQCRHKGMLEIVAIDQIRGLEREC